MCGILAVIGPAESATIQTALDTMRHRGPDGRGGVVLEGLGQLHHVRLAIVDAKGGSQPLRGCGASQVVFNGEIYNHRELRQRLERDGHEFGTRTDGEVISHILEAYGPAGLDLLDGDFALVASVDGRIVAARDPVGVKPLYWGEDSVGSTWFASELKALLPHCTWVEVFPPGHYFAQRTGLRRFTKPLDAALGAGVGQQSMDQVLRTTLQEAVEKRLMGDLPVASLLSGGLDSSLIAALASRAMQEPLRTFSVGAREDSTDLLAARKVSAHLGACHTEVQFNFEEGLALIPHVVAHVESFDLPTVRAGVPMFVLSRAVRDAGYKAVLTGEGADETLGGYNYLFDAPSDSAFEAECDLLVEGLHTSDVLRVDRASMAASVEARVPFLDRAWIELVLGIPGHIRRPIKGKDGTVGRIEKRILRQAFDSQDRPIIPRDVLWRRKEQFSDGVGYGWLDAIKRHADEVVSDADLRSAASAFDYAPPRSKEALLYRRLFAEFYPGGMAARTVRPWLPKWQSSTDSSGRASRMHESPYGGAAPE